MLVVLALLPNQLLLVQCVCCLWLAAGSGPEHA